MIIPHPDATAPQSATPGGIRANVASFRSWHRLLWMNSRRTGGSSLVADGLNGQDARTADGIVDSRAYCVPVFVRNYSDDDDVSAG